MRCRLAGLIGLVLVSPAAAAVVTAPVVGCSSAADAGRIAALRGKGDKGALDALTRPLVARRACLDFAKGLTVDVDESKPPLTCIRLTGDLSCYWVPATLVDEHPGQKGGGGGRKGGGSRRR